jgi:hypothetical protein
MGRRSSWNCSGADPRRERSTDRNRIPAISGSEDARCLCRQTCMHRGPRNDDYACIQWAARAQRSDRIRPSSDRSECSSSSTVSCPTRINSRNAGSCTASWRFRSYAIVGRPVGQVSTESTSRDHRSTVVERRIAATVVIGHPSSHQLPSTGNSSTT